MPAPRCPGDLELKALIALQQEQRGERWEDTLNALVYLQTFLSNRKGYQRKMQLKRAALMKMAKEQGWMEEIDDAVKAQHANVMEAASLDDVDDVDDSEVLDGEE
jgi:hypothetical protein